MVDLYGRAWYTDLDANGGGVDTMAKVKEVTDKMTEAVLDQEIVNDGVDILNGVGVNGADGGASATKPARKKQARRDQIMFVVPAELLALVKARAAESEGGSKSMAEYVRELVAKEFNFVLPPMQKGGGGFKRYGSKEEADAAKKAKAADRNKLIAALLDKARTGEIDLSALGIDIPVPAARAKSEPTATEATEAAEATQAV